MSQPITRRELKKLEAAEGYLLLEMPDHALRELDAVRDPGGRVGEWHRLRAEVQRCKGDHESALREFERAHADDPLCVSALFGVAWCSKRTDRLGRAIEAMLEAYRLEPDSAVVMYNLACYYSLAGEREQALSWLGRALRCEGDLRHCVAGETDFDPLREDPAFQFVVGNRSTLDDR